MSERDDFAIALSRFDLRAWLTARGFQPQGWRQAEWLADCPFCGREAKFSFNLPTRKFRCFICEVQAPLVDVMAKYEGSRAAAVHAIFANQISRTSMTMEIIEPALRARPYDWEPTPVPPPDGFTLLREHTHYTRRRNLSIENLVLLGAGTCSWGRFQDRIVFPVRRAADGAWLYYQGRAQWERSEDPIPKKYMKNLNPPSAKNPALASASDVLLGLDLVEHYRLDHVCIVEGPTDWTQVGVGAVALLGKSLSPRQISLLQRAGVRRVTVMMDPDAWEHPVKVVDGVRYVQTDKPIPAVTVCERLAMLFSVDVVRYPDGFDAGDYSPSDNALWRASAQPWDPARLRLIL